MDRQALNQGQKTDETTVRFSIERTIESMDRFAIMEGQKNFERTVRISKTKNLLKQRLDFQ